MTDIQAALGISQMNRLDSFIQKRHEICKRYNEYFQDLASIKLPYQNKDSYSSLHLYVIRVDNSKSKASHKQLFNYLRDNNIGVNIHYIQYTDSLIILNLDLTFQIFLSLKNTMLKQSVFQYILI